MKYLLKNVSSKNFYLINSVNKSENITLNYKKETLFGNVVLKNKLSKFYKTNSNMYFSKNRKLKNTLLNINQINLSMANGFFFELLLVGLGFKVVRLRLQDFLLFELHFSHKLYYKIPKNVSIRCIKKKIVLFGIDKAQLVTIAEQIKALRYPNTYKGKGIRYVDEIVKLKPGKQR